MSLLPVSRDDYRRKQEPDFLEELRVRVGDFHLLPEGGSNSLAIKGCEEIASLLKWQNRRLKAAGGSVLWYRHYDGGADKGFVNN